MATCPATGSGSLRCRAAAKIAEGPRAAGRYRVIGERIARLRIELQELEPKIWRRIDMPLSTTMEALHEAIQMTMGRTFSHLWEFEIDGLSHGDPSFREFDDEPVIYKAKGLRLSAVIARGAFRLYLRLRRQLVLFFRLC